MTPNTEMSGGKYVGRVIDVESTKSKVGNDMLVFTWMLENGNQVKSYAVTNYAQNGDRNEKAIPILRQVFSKWDGNDWNWFVENADMVIGVVARLTIVMTEFNGRRYPNVKFVAPAPNAEMSPPAPTRFEPPKKVDTSAIPEDIEPTMAGAWRAFYLSHPGWSKPQLDEEWFKLEDRYIVPNKDQADYTTEDWQRLIEVIRGEEEVPF